jgi:hypothetical protein
MMASTEHPIAAPTPRLDALERETECRAALRDRFAAVAAAAEHVGWTADEAALALLRLAGAHVNERVTNSIALAAVRSSQRAFASERRNMRPGEQKP